jgi:cobalt/nickel transport system permease protein
MHIPDGFLSTPVIAATYSISVSSLAIIWHKIKAQFSTQSVPRIAMLAAFLFVAQMINIPISGGTSGHLLGGFLAALLVGPYAGIFIIAIVLMVQMLIFQDGGLTAWGANVLNMGLAGAGGGYLLFFIINRYFKVTERSHLLSSAFIFLGAWLSVEFGALFCGLELGLSGLAGMNYTVGVMVSVHAVIGILEGVLTVFIFEAVQAIRPDLVYFNQKKIMVEDGITDRA